MLADCPRTNTNPAIIANAANVRKRSQKAARAFIGRLSRVVVSLLGRRAAQRRVRLQVSRVARARHTVPKNFRRLVTYTGPISRTIAPVRLPTPSFFVAAEWM